jgi:mRNA interferase RelE/StbE
MDQQWQVEWDERALKELTKIDRQAQKDIIHHLKTRIATNESPKRFGQALVGNKAGLWRYRVKDYRLICNIEDGNLVVLVLRASYRKNVYEK